MLGIIPNYRTLTVTVKNCLISLDPYFFMVWKYTSEIYTYL